MIKKLLWQIKQFFVPFPDKESWAYAFHMWMYDRKVGPAVNVYKQDWNLEFPTDFNYLEFKKTVKQFVEAVNQLKEFEKEIEDENRYENIYGPDGSVIASVDSDGRLHTLRPKYDEYGNPIPWEFEDSRD